jgi:hypothetical protein
MSLFVIGHDDRKPDGSGGAPTNGSPRRRHVLPLAAVIFAVACGGNSTGPTRTETFTGFLGSYSSHFSPAHGSEFDATLTWTVPAEGTRPIVDLSFWRIGIPDLLQARSTPSDTPPVTLKGSGSYVSVRCTNCQDSAPIPFTLTVIER